jgi:hypothetical protein
MTMSVEQPPAKAIWSRLGGQLGVGLCAVGFLLVFLGWNGAASLDRLPSQFPYLISGGVAGLCFVIVGVGMIVVQNQRADRAALQATLLQLQESLARAGLAADTADRPVEFQRPGPRPPEARPAPVADDEVELEPVGAEPTRRARRRPLKSS